MEQRLNAYLNSIDDDESTVTDNLLEDILRWTPARRAKNNAPVTYSAGVPSAIAQKPVQREIGAYEARGFFSSAAAECQAVTNRRKMLFDAEMQQWERVIKMCEKGAL